MGFLRNRNVRRFVELCARHGLHVIVRLGPFCHGEVRATADFPTGCTAS